MVMEKSMTHVLEQFVLLAKSAKGAAAVELIKQVLDAPGVYVFGELLDMPNIQELGESDVHLHKGYLQLLCLFSFGTYGEYKEQKGNLPELTPVQIKKLKHLTVVSLANKSKYIPYTALLEELDIGNVRELEDLIIEAIYADIIHGKLDLKNQHLEVDYTIGRDVRPEVLPSIINILQEWCDASEITLANIEAQVKKANMQKEHYSNTRVKIETEVANIKKTLKAQAQEYEETMVVDSAQPSVSQQEKPTKKVSKAKGLRGSGKFWKSSS